MKWLNRLAALLFGLITLGMIKDFLEKNRLIIINDKDEDFEIDDGPKDIIHLKPENYDKAMDIRGTPTQLCPCGSQVWNVKVIFNDSQIASYFLDMECANCGSLATAPTPIDNRGNEI
jgi:hypothetical protein